jgi:hypothetical protein
MSLSNKVDQFNGASDLVHRFVHADKNTDIQTQGGPVPSIAKLADVLQKRVIEVVELQRVLQQMLAANSGAGLVKTSDGKTVQAALDSKANASGSTTQDFTGKRLTAYNPANSVYLEGGVNGQAPAVVTTGSSDANVDLYVGLKGTGRATVANAAGLQLQIGGGGAANSAVNRHRIAAGAAGQNPIILAEGADTNIGFDFTAKGAGEMIYRGNNGVQFVIGNTLNAANYLRISSGAAGVSPTLQAIGNDANVNLQLQSKNGGNVTVISAGGPALYVQGQANGANVLAIFNAPLGAAPRLESVGGNSDIDILLTPKGAGSVRTGQIVASAVQIVGAAAVHGMQESDQTGSAGVWRWVADAGSFRLDWNTSASRNFATYKTVFSVNAAGIPTVPTPSNESQAIVNAEYVNSAIASAGQGAMVLLGQATVNPATPVANIDFLNICTAAYDHYIIDVNGAANSVASALLMRAAVGGVVDSASVIYTVPAADSASANNSDRINLSPGLVTLGSSLGRANFTVEVRNANSAEVKPIGVRGLYSRSDAGNVPYVVLAEGMYRGTSAISGFRFYWGAGSFTGGTIRIYGIKNA